MSDYDVVIIGGGPAGLTAGLYLGRGGYRSILLEKDNFGGNIKNVEFIENYPGFAEGIAGPQLASEMVSQAKKYGLQLESAEVVGLEIYSGSKWVQCTGGKGYTATAVIVAGGSRYKKLGVSGEKELEGKGVINCAMCEGGQFANKVVAVCGGGDTGVTEALYLSKLASKVILVSKYPALTATAVLREKALANPKLEIRYMAKIEAILGETKVEAIKLLESERGRSERLAVDGILVGIGVEPNTDYLKAIIPLDNKGQVMVNSRMETEIPGILAAGDIRHDSPRQVAAAVGDGVAAALSAKRFVTEQ